MDNGFHLNSFKLWMIIYVFLTVFDVSMTYIFISQPEFGISFESNPLIRNLMEQYGIWQGLTLYIIQEFVFFFCLWGAFYFVISRLARGRSREVQKKVDVFIFNIGVPFMIMGSAILHLFGGIFWLLFGITGSVELVDPLQLIVYVTVFLSIFQSYRIYNLNLPNEQSPATTKTN
ncbi:MAG: hypothetical protein EU536_01895 [Promethearchaeota archaeon]|nr:MAG: hypothetical protein EU536_01895 [Candidatus Lokiarchaeota archaeon]